MGASKAWFSYAADVSESSRPYRLDCFSGEWEHTPPTTRPISKLYPRHVCEVGLESTSQACRRWRLGWPMLPATCVLISEQYPRPCRRCIGGIWEPGLTCAQTWDGLQTYRIPLATQRRPPRAHTSHGTHHTEAIWVSGSKKRKNNNNLREMNRSECRLFTVPYFSVRSSISSALRYERPSWMSVKST